jgi:late embryogenesis abundant protein
MLAAVSVSCATLGQFKGLVQPPRFSQSDQRQPELRVLRPSSDLPMGGLGVRLWAKVSNPNPFGFTLGTLEGTLFLEGTRGATANFPIGLPLEPGEASEVPLDLSISLSDLPGLAGVARQATQGQPIAYRLEGTVGVDAGRLGQPTFGPMTFLTGDLTTR